MSTYQLRGEANRNWPQNQLQIDNERLGVKIHMTLKLEGHSTTFTSWEQVSLSDMTIGRRIWNAIDGFQETNEAKKETAI